MISMEFIRKILFVAKKNLEHRLKVRAFISSKKNYIRLVKQYLLLSHCKKIRMVRKKSIDPSNGIVFFFSARYSGEKVFIKAGTRLSKEIKLYSIYSESLKPIIPKCYFKYENSKQAVFILCLEFLGSYYPLSYYSNKKRFLDPKITIDLFLSVLYLLKNNRITHNDLSLDNIFISKDKKKIKVIDFEYCETNSSQFELLNDAHNIDILLNKMYSKEQLNHHPIYIKIKDNNY